MQGSPLRVALFNRTVSIAGLGPVALSARGVVNETVTALPLSAFFMSGVCVTLATLIGVADAGAAATRLPPTASSMAAPIDTSFLNVFELVIETRESKQCSKNAIKLG